MNAVHQPTHEEKALIRKMTSLVVERLNLQADFARCKERAKKEMDELSDVVRAETLTYFLPVLDNFERALQTEDGDSENFRAGVSLIYRQMDGIVKKLSCKSQ